MLTEWLDWTLEGKPASRRSGPLASGHYTLHGPGILELTPESLGANPHACVFSAAIHGNETAPVELLGELLAQIEAGMMALGSPVLVILGNLPALRQGKRFINTNLNRLFQRGLGLEGDEPARARELMTQLDQFYQRHAPLPALHYDLHTAIRTSLYPRFVVEPFGVSDIAGEQWRWLAGADIQAVLHQHQHSWTFSHYSKHYHGAQAFTFELGRVAPFGANDLDALRPMLALLAALAGAQTPDAQPPDSMVFFRVEQEIMRQSHAFTLCFDEDIPNFTAFPSGTLLARDAQAGAFKVGETPLHVVFPNARVEIGARAALLVTPVEGSHSKIF
ncbi:succinylglutamate desuccinylase [Vreelandella aquamarina]|uniref:succinylglutamate desuccinylase n=1 Tax=Vreelandella aquamarina TaxID=77097 RepID=UPI003850A84E